MNDFSPASLGIDCKGTYYKVVAQCGYFTVFNLDGVKLAVLEFLTCWQTFDGFLDEQTTTTITKAIDGHYGKHN